MLAAAAKKRTRKSKGYVGVESAMPVERFAASRWTRGNFLSPTVIEVTDTAVVRRKPPLLVSVIQFQKGFKV
jgi:hypothetical protein